MVYVKCLVQKIYQSLSLSWSCFGEKVFENIKNYFGGKAAIYTRCSIGLGLFSNDILNVAFLIRPFESFTNQMMFHIPLQVVIIIIMQ